METACVHLPEVDSTSKEVRRRFDAGEDGPLWVRADRQSAGYGRRGRSWQSPEGNLAATLLLPLKGRLGPEDPAGYGFAAALAIADAARACGVPPTAVTLKWPNDVLLEGGKLAGLLIELLEWEGGLALALGMGVNLASAPAIAAYPTSAIAAYAPAPAPERFLTLLDGAFFSRLESWKSDGFPALRDAWLARAQGIGDRIEVRLPKATLTGIFEGLAPDGTLRLRQGEETVIVTAGDVFFPGQGG
ncbi:biotin--[acetyl-CoA-carboxylase] ligase [Parvularcula oceani]|uniref:biotin--[acetyl-CoA-carboxylase] ligase n=1 Tax=Parvularcula oceani TaxID=1247963 RepID=UPI0004E26E49|nr:biotin--[acetyl-CoA-carboxylase] ligase [Parvularcula oceani]